MKFKKVLSISFLLITTTIIFSSCSKKNKKNTQSKESTSILKYAKRIKIIERQKYTELTLINPWDTTKILQKYILIPKLIKNPKNLPEGIIIKTPLNRALISTSLHCNLLKELGVINSITGVCESDYINIPEIKKRIEKRCITDVGNSYNPDIEKIIDLNPEAIFLSPFENSGGHGKITQLNIPIFECADYMETSPLGCAEWIKIYGRLFGVKDVADTLFSKIEKKYYSLKDIAAKAKNRPTVLYNLKSGSAWYVPGGQSTIAGLFKDANINYAWKKDKHNGSFPLAFETVFDKCQNADIWLIKYYQEKDKTYEDLGKDNSAYKKFKSYKDKNIYGCNTKNIPYYEETPFHPELLLKDFIKIFHPELLKDYEPKFYTKIKVSIK